MSRKASPSEDRAGFQPIDPWKSEDLIITRRNLPHLEVPGATYFVTLHCIRQVVLSHDARGVVLEVIRTCDGKNIDLEAAVVMPDHAHLIFRLIGGGKLSRFLQRIKGRTARLINQIQNAKGSTWLDESFDHIIRHEAELHEKIEYLRNNPIKNGLADKPENYRWLYVRGTQAKACATH